MENIIEKFSIEEEFYKDEKDPINKFMIWDNGYTAYVERLSEDKSSSCWERLNLSNKSTKLKLNPRF
jgi:hypothetical protein